MQPVEALVVCITLMNLLVAIVASVPVEWYPCTSTVRNVLGMTVLLMALEGIPALGIYCITAAGRLAVIDNYIAKITIKYCKFLIFGSVSFSPQFI